MEEAREKGIHEIRGEIEEWELESGRYLLSGDGWEISADKVVTAIGREPEEPERDFGYGEVSFPSGSTEVDNFYTIGSMVLGQYRQASLSWGMGIAAGMDIAERVKKR